jgi:DNA-binding response OmpR family regulator
LRFEKSVSALAGGRGLRPPQWKGFEKGSGKMRHRILLIDDSHDMHELVRASLQDEPLSVGSMYDGKSGIELARQLPPDLILLDLDLPDADGFEICDRLQNDPLTARIPVVFLTAAGATEQKVRGLDLGGSDYITKPFDPLEFAARIRAILRAKSTTDSIRSKRVNEFIGRALGKAA